LRNSSRVLLLYYALISSLLFCLQTAPARAQSESTLAQRIQKIISRPEFAHANFGIEFCSLDTGKALYALNADKLFVPASTTKILTEGALLAKLGADYRFHTRVYRTGSIDKHGTLKGHLILVASGDPNLSNRIQPDGTLAFDYDRPQSVGRVRAFYGNFGMFVRALAYILANGPDGLRQTTEDAVLNANYIRKGLEGIYDLPYSTPSMHEVVFSDKLQARKGVKTMDLAKRLIDYGFHPYTTAFPLIVPGALMIEPTESESVEEMDLFVEAMKSIAEEVEEDPQIVLDAPHSTRVSRLDETAAARKPVLRWKPGT